MSEENILIFLYNFPRFPDDEDKKNALCTPLNAPQLPAQWFALQYGANMNADKIGKALGLGWMRYRRLSPLSHVSLKHFLKIMIYMVRNKEKINEKMKAFGEQEELYGNFDVGNQT